VKVSGKRTFDAPLAVVWSVLNDPSRMAQTMPGVEGFEIQDDRHWTANVKVPLGLGGLRMTIAMEKVEEREPDYAKLNAKGQGVGEEAIRVGLSAGTIALSWAFVQFVFALHYAHAYYGEADEPEATHRCGLDFPGDEAPDYWDFLHFALIIGVASQTADIQISDKRMRRLSTIHSVTAFLFNTVIVALTVNLAVGLMGGN
jgi:hypothetical protein